MDPTPKGLAPLLRRTLDDSIADIRSSLPTLNGKSGKQSVSEFLHQVEMLALQLPKQTFAINLCENRYLFLLAFCAVIRCQQTNLLPQNRSLATQQYLCGCYKEVYVLHDGTAVAQDLPQLNLQNLSLPPGSCSKIPQISLAHLAAIAFTSGSTGKPQPNMKTWQTFVRSTAINSRYMLPDTNVERMALEQTDSELADPELSELATVPGQHMWGLETSILIPLMNNVCISDSKPLLPQDVKNRLQDMQAPRLMVSTPVHLRALAQSGLSFPKVERILCATAPLSEKLAHDSEQLFGSELHEVFGCSEVGSMAIRRTSNTQTWNLFDGLNMESTSQKKKYSVKGDHLPGPVLLEDQIEQLNNRQFCLLGRGNDMLEIAGKRGSLQEMNKILLSAPQVADGIVFLPPSDEKNNIENKGRVRRLVAIVAFNNEQPQNKKQLTSYFRQRLDAAFIPRPIFAVNALPREENGKLPHSNLLKLYRQLKG